MTSSEPRTGLYGMVLSELTLSAIQAEATGAHARHGDRSMLGEGYTPHERLAILMEEVGEVAHELTYDQSGDRDKLVRELIQVAAMAATWVEHLEGIGAQARRRAGAEGITGIGWNSLGHGGGQ